jgi:hypothetical protein
MQCLATGAKMFGIVHVVVAGRGVGTVASTPLAFSFPKG